jgi:hypothetical protein
MTQGNRAAVLEMLGATPRRIASVTRSLSRGDLNWKPAADSWSIHEILAHLRCCADVWGESIRKILRQHHPAFRYVSPRGWIKKTNYLELEFQVSFRAFHTQRQELLETLRALPEEAWLRRASVKAATKVRDETVLSYAWRLADHEFGHCEQIDRVLHALSLCK